MTGLRIGRFFTTVTEEGEFMTVYEPPLFDDSGDEKSDILVPSMPFEERCLPNLAFSIEERWRFWNCYLDARTGSYESRCRRFDAVIDVLRGMGMRDADTIMDLGAGRGEFGRRLREQGHRGMYVPVDGSIDGCDLNEWEPPDRVDWSVAIEVLEHLEDPERLLTRMMVASRFGLVVTTPNAQVVDVLGMDPTHIRPIHCGDLGDWGLQWEAHSLFTDGEEDTLVGWYDRRSIVRAPLDTRVSSTTSTVISTASGTTSTATVLQ